MSNHLFYKTRLFGYLKLRGSIASCKDAGPLEIDPQLEPTYLTGVDSIWIYRPNRKLKQMTTSQRLVLKVVLKDRISVDFTYFNTRCSDQIVKGFRLSYAIGFVLNNMNVGTFDTWGWEGHYGIYYVVKWIAMDVGFNLSHVNSEVVYLPEM